MTSPLFAVDAKLQAFELPDLPELVPRLDDETTGSGLGCLDRIDSYVFIMLEAIV